MAISFVFLSFGALQFGEGNKDSIIGHHLFPHDIKEFSILYFPSQKNMGNYIN
jgi:hypothetical protein